MQSCGSGSGDPRDPGREKIQIRDEHSGSGDLSINFLVKNSKFIDADLDPESGILSTLIPGSGTEKKSDPDPQQSIYVVIKFPQNGLSSNLLLYFPPSLSVATSWQDNSARLKNI
jgi:hypothetical protein